MFAILQCKSYWHTESNIFLLRTLLEGLLAHCIHSQCFDVSPLLYCEWQSLPSTIPTGALCALKWLRHCKWQTLHCSAGGMRCGADEVLVWCWWGGCEVSVWWRCSAGVVALPHQTLCHIKQFAPPKMLPHQTGCPAKK